LGNSQTVSSQPKAHEGTPPIELEKPEKPKESSTDFLTRWDFWIRLANFGELALAAVTFIYIRNRSAKFNESAARRDDEIFPSELDADVSVRGGVKEPRLTTPTTPAKTTTLVSLNSDDTDAHKRTTQSDAGDGLKRLRAALKLISFYSPGVHLKADVKGDCVWIRAMESKHGE